MVKLLPPEHPIQRIKNSLRERIERAQSNTIEHAFTSAGDICQKAFEDLRIVYHVPQNLLAEPLSTITAQDHTHLKRFFTKLLLDAGFPEQATFLHAENLSQRIQLLQAFDRPDETISHIEEKIRGVVDRFPKNASDIEKGKNPGDILDPYIFAATQYLVCGSSFDKAVEVTVAHKALMMVESLIGHLHEDVIGEMRGNVRAPEPRGKDQETLDPENNPFPGADIIQPPLDNGRPLRFHQLKSKTGSAKGGDGRRLGEQLQRLQDIYGGDIFYHALTGNTLQGHRSKAGVERAAPKVTVLVGAASFRELTGSNLGAQLLLRVYQTAFMNVQAKSNYTIETVISNILATFKERALQEGDDLLEVILRGATKGNIEDQDSRLYNPNKQGKR